MRLSLLSTLLLPATLAFAAPPQQIPAEPTSADTTITSTATLSTAVRTAAPIPESQTVRNGQILELRQADVTAVGATLAEPTSTGFVTTEWLETTINGVPTYLPFAYTQTYASVPDQLPSAASGSIGLGDSSSAKATTAADKSSSAAARSSGKDAWVVAGLSLAGVVVGMGLL